MTRQEAIQQQIDEIMDEFDFRKVAEYMKDVEWEWNTKSTQGVPCEQELRLFARKTMRRLAESGERGWSTGGFDFTFTENPDERWLRFSVKFVLEGYPMDGTSYDAPI